MVKTPAKLLGMILFLLVAGCTFTLYTTRLSTGKKGINRDKRGLTEVPEDILADTLLRSLSLFGNELDSLPDGFKRLQDLQVLYLGRNKFVHFPKELCALKSLRILSLAYNDIDSLPDCLCEMENLEWLVLNNNRLTHLPDSLGKLKRLQQLHLKRNRLDTLPSGLFEVLSLQYLDLSYNNLTALDKGLGNLHQLKELRVYRAGFLMEIPESVCELRFLERLNIDPTVALPMCILTRKTNRLVIQSVDF